MANLTRPPGARFKGWFFDAVNGQLEFWYNGTKVGGIDASGLDVTNDTTTYISNGVVASAALTSSGAIGSAALSANARTFHQAFNVAAIASNGAVGSITNVGLYFSASAVLDSVWAANISASDVTVGTATSSASYRRTVLICNTAATGTGTDIIASLNATASAAAGATRGFTIAASTIPAGAVVQLTQITIGAATADGTDAAARTINIAYHYL